MDFAMQEWSTIVVGLLIVIVLLHAIKSILASRNEKLRSADVKAANAGEDGFGSELPNGGARVIGERFDETAQELNDSIRNGYVASRRVGNKRVVNPPAAPLGKVDRVRHEEQALPSASVNTSAQAAPKQAALGDELWDDRKEPSLGDFPDILMDESSTESASHSVTKSRVKASQAASSEEHLPQNAASTDQSRGHTEELETEETEQPLAEPSMETTPELDDPLPTEVHESDSASVDESTTEPDSTDEVWSEEPEEWLILHLSPPKQYVFTGEEFFAEIEKAGFTYAKNGGFVFADSELEQPVFYLANGTQPGTFPPEGERDAFETASLCFVLALPAPCDALRAFLKMDKCAEALATALQGQLTDDERSHYTVQTREHYRQRALQFDRSQLSRNYS